MQQNQLLYIFYTRIRTLVQYAMLLYSISYAILYSLQYSFISLLCPIFVQEIRAHYIYELKCIDSLSSNTSFLNDTQILNKKWVTVMTFYSTVWLVTGCIFSLCSSFLARRFGRYVLMKNSVHYSKRVSFLMTHYSH